MLNSLPSNSKVFIFQADRFLTAMDIELINKTMNLFLPTWATHGAELTADFSIEKNLFVVVGNDESKVATSGCSKDSLTHVIQKIGIELGIDFFNRLNVSYESISGELKLVSMASFKALLQKDEVRQTTLVYNNLIETKADLLNKWLVPVKNSWHQAMINIV